MLDSISVPECTLGSGQPNLWQRKGHSLSKWALYLEINFGSEMFPVSRPYCHHTTISVNAKLKCFFTLAPSHIRAVIGSENFKHFFTLVLDKRWTRYERCNQTNNYLLRLRCWMSSCWTPRGRSKEWSANSQKKCPSENKSVCYYLYTR